MSDVRAAAFPTWQMQYREYHAWCRAMALELALKAALQDFDAPGPTDEWLLAKADTFHAYIDEGRMP